LWHGGAHLVIHGGGWMHGGRIASDEKLIIDGKLMPACFTPIAVGKASLALDAIAKAGVARNHWGTAQTMQRHETAIRAHAVQL
jgi:trimethylamine--corrinoid protein Co-methyltransferase